MFSLTGQSNARRPSLHLLQTLLLTLALVGFTTSASAQSGTDYTGTGGRHSIQGRIYFPSGRRLDLTNIKVKLESPAIGGLSVFADSNGSFSFRNLTPGSYTIVIELDTDYETVREPVFIDDSGSRDLRGGPARNISVPIYLIPKRSHSSGSKAEVINAALANAPAPARDLYQKALESAQAGDSKKAVEQLKAAISYYPEFALALNELGVQYLKLKQADKAVEVLQSAIRVAPDAFTPRLNYGIALLEKREFAEAESQLRQAVRKSDTSWTAHMYLGLTLINLRRYDEAEKELQRTLEVGGDHLSLPHYYLGGIYWNRHDYKRAAEELEKYLQLAPKAPDAERIRGTVKELRSKVK
jgi:Tfp pilus assembly protein PilF